MVVGRLRRGQRREPNEDERDLDEETAGGYGSHGQDIPSSELFRRAYASAVFIVPDS